MAKSNISKQWGDEPHHARPSYAKDRDLSYRDLSAEVIKYDETRQETEEE